ncbi:MAG: iron-containing alcohol dehydrogenase [Candidatus Omnitrophota bacterium]
MFTEITRFSFPTTIIFGPRAIKSLPECLQEIGVRKPLLVTDAVLLKTEAFAKTETALKEKGVLFALFSDVHPNPLEDDVEKAGSIFKSEGCDGVIGLGGGSSLDAAKAVTVRVAYDGPLARYEAQAGGYKLITGPLAPIIAIPTTAGTGSEVGRSAVITIPELGRKIVIFSPLLLPKRAIEDPELTVGLPPHLTAATGMDAFTHNLESLVAPLFHPLCDAIAVGGLELIIRYLERAVRDGSDIEARGYMMIAASMGAIAFQKDLGAAHSLAHPLSTEYGLNHGLANAVCLPAVMRFNKEAAAKEYAKTAGLFGFNTFGMPPLEAAERAIEAVTDLNQRIGIPARLRDCGVPEEGLLNLAKKAFLDSCHLTNPRKCTEEDLLALYRESW